MMCSYALSLVPALVGVNKAAYVAGAAALWVSVSPKNRNTVETPTVLGAGHTATPVSSDGNTRSTCGAALLSPGLLVESANTA